MSVPVQNKYVIGDLVRLVVRFQNATTGDWLAPDIVACELMDPDGTVTTPAAVYDEQMSTPDGVIAPGYYVDVDVQIPGAWYYRFDATGFGQAANEGTFYVEHSPFAGAG